VGAVDAAACVFRVFAGADAFYLMISPNRALTGSWPEYQQKVADSYRKAIADG
jgi:hypothetical protein